MYYFIVNPGSRSGRGKAVWEKVESILELEEVEYRVYFTAYRFHATELAAEITSRKGRITLVAVGGDGTVNEILDGISDFSRITFGYIPTGSSNDFARALALPTDTEEALEHILHPSYFRKIDVGTFRIGGDTRRFGVSCGCGFDASVCHEAMSSPMKDLLNRLHLGKLTYMGTAVKQLIRWKSSPAAILTDSGEKYIYRRCFFAAAMNCAYEGGGFKMAPKAVPDDGCLDIIVVAGLPKVLIAVVLPLAFKGLHTFVPGVHIIRAKSMKLKVGQRLPVHADGEAYFVDKIIEIGLEPSALTVIAPE